MKKKRLVISIVFLLSVILVLNFVSAVQTCNQDTDCTAGVCSLDTSINPPQGHCTGYEGCKTDTDCTDPGHPHCRSIPNQGGTYSTSGAYSTSSNSVCVQCLTSGDCPTGNACPAGKCIQLPNPTMDKKCFNVGNDIYSQTYFCEVVGGLTGMGDGSSTDVSRCCSAVCRDYINENYGCSYTCFSEGYPCKSINGLSGTCKSETSPWGVPVSRCIPDLNYPSPTPTHKPTTAPPAPMPPSPTTSPITTPTHVTSATRIINPSLTTGNTIGLSSLSHNLIWIFVAIIVIAIIVALYTLKNSRKVKTKTSKKKKR